MNIAILFGKVGSNFINICKDPSIKIGITYDEKSLALKNKECNVKKEVISDQKKLLNKLLEENISVIFLLGYMKKVPKEIINSFMVINLHPSLLPLHKGLNAVEKSFKSKTGCGITLHFASEEIDSGEILIQKEINITNIKTIEEYYIKLKKIEYIEVKNLLDKIKKLGYNNIETTF